LLNNVSSLIKSKLRKVDMLCRFAGDEFLIIFNNLNMMEARHELESVTNQIDEHNLISNNPYDISISYGFAEYNKEECNSIDDLIEKADNEMYQNKLKSRQTL